MAGLSPAEIAQPIRAIVRSERNTTVLMAEAAGVDRERRRLRLTDGTHIDWDFLVVACGAQHVVLRARRLGAVRAGPQVHRGRDRHPPARAALVRARRARAERGAAGELLSFAVIGGGPTGMELAGALAELSKFVLDRDFRNIDPTEAKVWLIEAGPRILPSFPEDLAESAVSQLRELGVQVKTGAKVTSIEPHRVHLGAESIPCSVVLWAAGVAREPLHRGAGRPARPVRPGDGGAGPQRARAAARLRHRRRRAPRRQGRAAAPRRQPRGHAAGPHRREVDPPRDGGPRHPAVQLLRQGLDGDHRPQARDRDGRSHAHVRLPGLDGVALRPHLVPHRLPQPARRR